MTRLRSTPTLLACLVLGAIVLAHLGLVGAGEWQGDEWFNFALLRRQGTSFLASRILTWSPRPVSEGLVYLYARLVDATGRPLIGGFLLGEWALLGLATFALLPGRSPARFAGTEPGRAPARPSSGLVFPGPGSLGPGSRGARALLGLAVAAMFLLGHQVAEVFYWPMGAAAYMTALACLTALVMLMLEGRHLSPRGRLAAAAAAVLAAGSAEVGAMACGCLALLLAAWELARARRPAFAGQATGWSAPGGTLALGWRLLLLALPVAASLAVLGLILHGRAAAGVALGPETRTLHALGPSLAAAAAQFAQETLALDAYPAGWSGLLEGVLAKGLLFLGLRWCCAAGLRGRAPAVHLWMLAGSLLAASFLSIAAALWQFGMVCCQRHDTLRQCLDALALLALAGLAAPDVGSAGLGASGTGASGCGASAADVPGSGASGSDVPGYGGPAADVPIAGAASGGAPALAAGPPRVGRVAGPARRRLLDPACGWWAAGGPACLLLAAGIALAHRGPLAARLPSLAHDWRQYGRMLRVRREVWASGRSPGPAMTFTLPPQGLVVGELDWPTGSYALADAPPWYVQGILMFFDKAQVTVERSQ